MIIAVAAGIHVARIFVVVDVVVDVVVCVAVLLSMSMLFSSLVVLFLLWY